MSRRTERAERTVFFVSDGTGVTVETLGHSLLSQFESFEFNPVIIPFVVSKDKARSAVARIDAERDRSGRRPIVFFSLVDESSRAIVESARAVTFDFFTAFIGRLEEALNATSNRVHGRAHGAGNSGSYLRRIDAVNFALATDDGVNTERYKEARIILVGLSRVGKTPTSLYLALQHGVFVANYPLAGEELESENLPPALAAWQERLFGLTIDPLRLAQIRSGRRPRSDYANPARVRRELEHCGRLLRRHHVPLLDTTTISVEEIAATILYRREMTPSLP